MQTEKRLDQVKTNKRETHIDLNSSIEREFYPETLDQPNVSKLNTSKFIEEYHRRVDKADESTF